ncbi:tetratricopeptide repeat protein [Photobacterium sp. TY1-4]|uniref:tetratricopeptide repeat protein n=1 Tax=Photobacterium sp. TY1-4 TaxID=2899122 RepID=UPI0021C07434|nr:tetratricopeptide repeat protein [Photobacterium sp. TY1-4]UXI03342.1 sel1 repeat family protein [Photobacterium sp. TY1-4]
MSNLVIGLSLAGGALVAVVVHYFAVMNRQRRKQQTQVLKDENYQRVLEKAKIAEREEKIFKANTGHIASQLSLAKEYEMVSIAKAIFWYRKAAELGNEIAQNALARLHRLDSSDSDGEAKSRYWEQVVRAKQQEPEALFLLGSYQYQGYGTEQNIAAAIEHMTLAAEQDHVEAQLFLGDWYVAESNPDKMPLLAFGWRVRAALNESVKGCIKVAYCYQAGIGVAKDRRRAIYWLERAAETGSAEGQFLAAKMHLGGEATEAAIAYVWYSIAHAFGHPQARTERDQAAHSIAIDAILSAQSVANSVYRKLKDQPVARHAVISVLDKVYDRQRYRPDEQVLVSLSGGELAGDPDQAEAIASRDGEVTLIESPSQSSNSGQTSQRQEPPEVAAAETEAEIETAEVNVTAANEYREQGWATSWDKLTTETQPAPPSRNR